MRKIQDITKIDDLVALRDNTESTHDVTILLLDVHDPGSMSPFEIKRVKIYSLAPGESTFSLMSEGACLYNPQIDVSVLSLYTLGLLVLSFILPFMLSLFGLVSIPEQC